MKAVTFHKHGGADVLQYEDVPDPQPPKANEVLVDIQAVGINHLDIWVRMGMPGVTLPLPHIPGSDAAGVIAECGKGVEDLAKGDRVIISPGMGCGECKHCTSGWDSLCDSYHLLGLQVDGTYCEKIVVPARRVIKVPESLSFEEWAAVPLVFLTAWHMFHGHANIQSTDKVLVHSAGSGIGSAAIQIARLAGAEVFTTVGSQTKAEKASALGAQHVIHYKEKDFSKEVKALTDDRGVDIIFEHIGPETWQKNLACLAKGGRMVTCGATSGPNIEMDVRLLFMRQQTIKGSYMGGHEELTKVLELLGEGKLKPVVDQTFSLKEAGKAHAYLESRQNFGKIILRTSS